MFSPRRFLFVLGACAALLVPGAALAQTIESTPVPMLPKPDFSSMSYLVGTWTCSSKSARRPAAYTGTTTYSMSPDGWWIEETTVQNAMPWFPTKTTTYDKITYDSDTKRWIDVSYGDLGAYGLATSSGWNGNAMVWHDANFAPGSDVKSTSDITMTKNSDAKMTSTSSFTEASGRSIGVVTTCTKNG